MSTVRRECGCKVDFGTGRILEYCGTWRFGCWLMYFDQQHPWLSWLLPGILGAAIGGIIMAISIFAER